MCDVAEGPKTSPALTGGKMTVTFPNSLFHEVAQLDGKPAHLPPADTGHCITAWFCCICEKKNPITLKKEHFYITTCKTLQLFSSSGLAGAVATRRVRWNPFYPLTENRPFGTVTAAAELWTRRLTRHLL